MRVMKMGLGGVGGREEGRRGQWLVIWAREGGREGEREGGKGAYLSDLGQSLSSIKK
jgi:hypothetical protein